MVEYPDQESPDIKRWKASIEESVCDVINKSLVTFSQSFGSEFSEFYDCVHICRACFPIEISVETADGTIKVQPKSII